MRDAVNLDFPRIESDASFGLHHFLITPRLALVSRDKMEFPVKASRPSGQPPSDWLPGLVALLAEGRKGKERDAPE